MVVWRKDGGQVNNILVFLVMNGSLPNLLEGFLLKRARNKLWTSGLRNCGMPSFALRKKKKTKQKTPLNLLLISENK